MDIVTKDSLAQFTNDEMRSFASGAVDDECKVLVSHGHTFAGHPVSIVWCGERGLLQRAGEPPQSVSVEKTPHGLRFVGDSDGLSYDEQGNARLVMI